MHNTQQQKSAIFIFAFGLCFAFLLPNHYYPWLSFHQEFLVAACGIPLLLYSAIYTKTIPIETLVPFVMVALCIAQWAIGIVVYFGDMLLASTYLLGFGCAVLVGQYIASVEGGREQLSTAMALALIGAGIVSVGVSAHQVLGLDRLEVWVVTSRLNSRAIGNLAQSNHLHTLFMLGIASTLWLWGRRILSARGRACS